MSAWGGQEHVLLLKHNAEQKEPYTQEYIMYDSIYM